MAKFAELPILRGDIFANAPSDVGWPQLPLNNLRRHRADYVVSDLRWQVGRDRGSNEHEDFGAVLSDRRRP